MTTFPCHFHGQIDHIDKFGSKSKFSINPKISVILTIDIPLRSVNMCQNGNPSRSGVRVGVLDKTTRKFFKNIGFKFLPYIQLFIFRYFPQLNIGEKFKTYIFEKFSCCFVRDPNADSRPRGISIWTHIDRSQGNVNFQNDRYFRIYGKFGF